MANDRTPKPSKPQGDKQSDKLTDLSEKSVDAERDEQVKGGRQQPWGAGSGGGV